MAKKTLLKIVQNILSSIDGDEVNSINDTVEAQQVAEVVGTVYDAMSDSRNWPHMHKLGQLENVSDISRPTHLKLAVDVKEITKINYNKRKIADDRDKYGFVEPMRPEQFLEHVNSRNTTNDNVRTIIDTDGATIFILDDTPPQFWTSFDDEFIVFDNFDEGVETTLQGSKTQILAYFDPAPFQLIDSFIADLPSEAFTALQAEAKSTAHLEINQLINNKAEQVSRRSQSWLSQKAFKTQGGIRYKTNFGRRSQGRVTDKLLDLSSTSTRSNN